MPNASRPCRTQTNRPARLWTEPRLRLLGRVLQRPGPRPEDVHGRRRLPVTRDRGRRDRAGTRSATRGLSRNITASRLLYVLRTPLTRADTHARSVIRNTFGARVRRAERECRWGKICACSMWMCFLHHARCLGYSDHGQGVEPFCKLLAYKPPNDGKHTTQGKTRRNPGPGWASPATRTCGELSVDRLLMSALKTSELVTLF